MPPAEFELNDHSVWAGEDSSCFRSSGHCDRRNEGRNLNILLQKDIYKWTVLYDRICDLVVTVLGYRSRGPGSIPGTARKKVVGLERGLLSLVSTTEELLDRKVAAPV
jgi:hypothetical protein